MLYRLLFDTVEPLLSVDYVTPYWATSNQSPNDGFSIVVITSIIQPDPFKQPLSISSRLAVKGRFACSLNPCHFIYLEKKCFCEEEKWQDLISLWLTTWHQQFNMESILITLSVFFFSLWCFASFAGKSQYGYWYFICKWSSRWGGLCNFKPLDPTFPFTQTRQDKTTLLHFDTFYSDDGPGTADSRLKLIKAGQEQ